MEEVNGELLGRLQGYVNWASEVVWHKQKHDSLKQQSVKILKKQRKKGYDVHAQLLKQLSDVVARKQVPLHEQNVHVHEDIRETMNLLKIMFSKAHAELFVEDAVYASESMHEHAVLLHDAICKQALLLKAVSQQTYDDVVPQVIFLCEKEAEIKQKLQYHAEQVSQSSVKVLLHINENYFVRMKKLALDHQYIEDQRQVFVAGYALALCSKTLATLYEVPIDMVAVEEVFLSNVAPKQ